VDGLIKSPFCHWTARLIQIIYLPFFCAQRLRIQPHKTNLYAV